MDPKDRYIPYMEEDLSVSIHGKMYYRTDFEDTKQSLATHSWDAELGYYTIEFKNLALSAKTRLYRMTMIFRLALTAETSPVEPELVLFVSNILLQVYVQYIDTILFMILSTFIPISLINKKLL